MYDCEPTTTVGQQCSSISMSGACLFCVKMAAKWKKGLSSCSSCGNSTKYSCIKCDKIVCLRSECSVPEADEDIIGWEEYKSVAYCFSCANRPRPIAAHEELELKSAASLPSKTLKRSETPSTASIGTLLESDNEDIKARKATEFQGDTTQTDTSGAESEIGKKKRGRKATWQESQITDMVNIIVNNEALLRKLVFTNTKKACNTDAYQNVLIELNEQYKKDTGKDFPFTVKQMRSKFMWCVAICKNISLTIKKASGIKRIVDEKGYGKWFNLLFPFVKSRDSCDPAQAIEPGNCPDVETELDHDSECSDQGDNDEAPSKHAFVPKKSATAKRSKTEHLAKAVELLNTAIENDPTKEMLQLMREEMQQSRQQEVRYLQMICSMVMPNQGNIGSDGWFFCRWIWKR